MSQTETIYSEEMATAFQALEVLEKDREDFYKEMKRKAIKRQRHQKIRKTGRNESCPCGSGRKFKKCCLRVRNASR